MDDTYVSETPIPDSLPPYEATAADAAVAAGDEDAEWEYEYSTTETETHLVTLDLSIPEFLHRNDEHIVHNTRGGFRSWMNPLVIKDDAPTPRDSSTKEGTKRRSTQPQQDRGGAEGREDDDDDDDDNDNDSDNSERIAAVRRRPGLKEEDGAAQKKNEQQGVGEPDPTDIQILELHAAEPILAYRGMVFQGAWAEHIGTEMLFTEHEEPPSSTTASAPPALPLAAVRRLPQDVDLLGASTARISCTPVELRLRKDIQQAERLENARKRLSVKIPVPQRASAQQKKQAAFLETLMAIKRRRGEKDVVTVNAVETTQSTVRDDADEAQLQKKKKAQMMRYQRRLKRQRDTAAEEVGEAEAEAEAEAEGEAEAESAHHGETSRPPVAPASRRGWKRRRTDISRIVGDLTLGSDHSSDDEDNNNKEEEEEEEDDNVDGDDDENGANSNRAISESRDARSDSDSSSVGTRDHDGD
ncbi:Transcription factor TFIIIC, tau55-related protein [Niveomyces insectorum RCEF 264]|uniref:Transcription factor TFIIIC, tau55-related protein n=1 Tax=Niveomyces insectorum RCEF 264 TaxID=1081102 RepID=A0A162JA13_9HYPO|nr:Transcription factor TFIIIC, tau55-related protein [Niveomyces insectorum RCEF 264]